MIRVGAVISRSERKPRSSIFASQPGYVPFTFSTTTCGRGKRGNGGGSSFRLAAVGDLSDGRVSKSRQMQSRVLCKVSRNENGVKIEKRFSLGFVLYSESCNF